MHDYPDYERLFVMSYVYYPYTVEVLALRGVIRKGICCKFNYSRTSEMVKQHM